MNIIKYRSAFTLAAVVQCLSIWYSSKVTSHCLDILECKLSACQVNLLMRINSLYSVKTEAQRKNLLGNAIERTNTVRPNSFFVFLNPTRNLTKHTKMS